MIYRYYRKPTTFRAVNCVRRLIENGRLKPSEIVSIRGSFSIQRWYRLTIRTNTEQLQFTGFSWFYHGSGPLGLQQVLRWLLIPGVPPTKRGKRTLSENLFKQAGNSVR
ncbi:hypothetical protein OB446_027765 [Paenibacillus alvei]|uniref:hypothetical protein n=1 Tax=Paenibacillus alvei TaxID=44250 RepID=UPI00028824BF|nr:hypothetical protein [Paenibacillus alvei]EJW14359.1 hypothetical protein PAV_14c00520 [Paenibacillus alvei DSM 29]